MTQLFHSSRLRLKNRAFLIALIIWVATIYGLAIVRMKGLH